MNPTQIKSDTLDEIIAMMDDAMLSRVPGREPAAAPAEVGGGIKVEKESVELDPMSGESPAAMAEEKLSGGGEMEMDMSEDDLQALMSMYGDEEEESY